METEHFPLAFTIIAQTQAEDQKLQETLNQYPIIYFKNKIVYFKNKIVYFKNKIVYQNKIVIPVELQTRLIEW